MNDEEQGVQAIDNEMLLSAVMTHRLEYPEIRRSSSPGTRALTALMHSPNGRVPVDEQAEEKASVPRS